VIGAGARAQGYAATVPQSLVVSETFVSVQGEGPSTGERCSFIRLGGCNLHCTWCMSPDTPVLMADWSEKPICDVKVGDWVASFRNRRFEVARVERTMTRWAEQRVTVRYGDREVVCTPDHVFATPHQLDGRRRTPAGDLAGLHVRTTRTRGWLPDDTVRTEEWWTGWLQGLVLGDGHVGQSEASPYPKVWLRVCDRQLAEAFSVEVNRRGARTTVREAKRRTSTGRPVYSVVCALSRVPDVVGLPDTNDGIAGFLAGFFDAEGHVGRNQVTMTQADDKTLDRIAGMCRALDIPVTVKAVPGNRRPHQVGSVTVNGQANVDRFMRLTRPVLDRKRTGHRRPDRMLSAVAVDAVKEANPGDVVNLTTSTGFFFANGALVEQCDAAYTWDADRFDLRAEMTRVPVNDLLAEVAAAGTRLTILTGGEPLLHQSQPGWVPLLSGLAELGRVEVETNGTVAPTVDTEARVSLFVCSPKLAHAGDPAEARIQPQALAVLRSARSVFKFVVRGEGDLDEVAGFVGDHAIPDQQVWIMPEGTDAGTVHRRLADLAPHVIDRGWNLSGRLHITCFGDRKGT
jgi:organic radical activating enzyme